MTTEREKHLIEAIAKGGPEVDKTMATLAHALNTMDLATLERTAVVLNAVGAVMTLSKEDANPEHSLNRGVKRIFSHPVVEAKVSHMAKELGIGYVTAMACFIMGLCLGLVTPIEPLPEEEEDPEITLQAEEDRREAGNSGSSQG